MTGVEVTTSAQAKIAEAEGVRVRIEWGERPKTQTCALSLEIITVP